MRFDLCFINGVIFSLNIIIVCSKSHIENVFILRRFFRIYVSIHTKSSKIKNVCYHFKNIKCTRKIVTLENKRDKRI